MPTERESKGNVVIEPSVDRAKRLLSEALDFHKKGELAKADALYREILRINPGSFDALHLLGVIASQVQKHQLAIELFDRAIAINPELFIAWSNRGNSLKDLNLYEAALASYDRAIALCPGFALAWSNRGNVLQELKQLDAAIESYDKAIALNPVFAEAYSNRGNALFAARQFEAALGSYDQAMAINPDIAEAWSNRGNALQELKQLESALACYDKALALKPDYATAWSNRGNALSSLKRYEEAVASCDKAIAINADYADANFNRGNALQALKQFEAALASYEAAYASCPDYEFLSGTILHLRMKMCDWRGFSENLGKQEAAIAAFRKAATPFMALGVSDMPELHKKAAGVYVDAKYPPKGTPCEVKGCAEGGKIRIGYYSADFYNHATAYLMAELFESHDREKFEFYGFSFGPDTQDQMSRRVASAFDRFIDVRNLSDREVAVRSRELGIDIAVDLKGFTQDSRPGIFAERCAPVQVSYLGYPGTMGAAYMDYIIADETVIPRESQSDFIEKVVYLPYSYQVNDSKRTISGRVFTKKELGLPESGFVFCCFNNNYKILPATFDGWMRILQAVDGSVLWLFEENPTAGKNLRKEAEARGVDASRLVFAKRMPLHEHLARHRFADLFIDTLPYNAHTTSSDALWAGLPVLTLMGKSFAGRVAASLLRAVELPELITCSQEEFEAKAVELATDVAKLDIIRRKLEKNRLTTPLFNAESFARHIESAFEAMYARSQSGLPPECIDVHP
ncbi:MAG: tetratricopeptide repeat protein [Chlorobiaceae bacterium]|nr:tetratricopeptide repeat protein [Chlorobiaceae bacterium]